MGDGFSQIISTVNLENERHFLGNSLGSFVLQTLANEVVPRIEQESLGLRNSVNSGPGVQERTEMVGQHIGRLSLALNRSLQDYETRLTLDQECKTN